MLKATGTGIKNQEAGIMNGIKDHGSKIRNSKFKIHNSAQKGFTLIEILLVIAAISILASIVIVAINPAKQLAQARNAQRSSNVNTILNAVWQYALDNDGGLPDGIPETTPAEICQTDIAEAACDTAGLVYLGELTLLEEYITSLPIDPQCPTAGTPDCDDEGIGYEISKSTNGRVTVSSPQAEDGETITVTR